ncbi:MAG: polyphosphate polymerase domain-containing protein [Planctomycetes bacterium]|nr:polyphosphate polymerase domain-containing protein [Planctomycetota bacterium]
MIDGTPCERNTDSANGKLAATDASEPPATLESAALSPSLWKNREEPAFEIKFQLSQEQARQVALWAREHLQLDPHNRPELDDSYRIHGLYFDTPTLDVFHRSDGYKKKKYRLRKYGGNDSIFLEQKRKSGGKVAKRRVQVEHAELARLAVAPTDDLSWIGAWFHRRIAVRQLQPICLISYQRQAFFGQNAEGPLRLTLDRNIRAARAQEWTVAEVLDGLAMLSDSVLLELKFRRHMPGLFKGLMQDLSLTPGPLSKYRLAVEALGLAARPEGAGR